MFDAFKAYVVELPTRLLLEDLVVYRSGDLDVFHSDYIESLRPDRWLTTLLTLADDVRSDSEMKFVASSKQYEDDRAKKFL
jgi:hypothetical protein